MQYFYSPGGTDAGTVHKSNDGILTLTHCICARNIHSPSSIIDVEDYLAAKKSLIMLLKNIDKAKIDEFKGARH
jgi:putative aminopeptidase FrvX